MQIGPYSVLGEIARGGHGVVYRAQDPQGQVVALKLLLAHRAQNEKARKRFQAEVNALSRLRHPHVVPILAAGEHEGCPWLALEYVEGEPLEARLRRGPLPIHEAIRVAQQLAQALSYVHACGVLHRDLKPDNVLLRGNQALVTDFGLVLDDQRSLSRITATGIFQGTPGYWAPEQARGETHEHGPATDVYGLGAVLYACLTGQAPVEAGSLQEYLQTVRFRATPSPRKLRPDVPGWLSELCMRCLALIPVQRPNSAEEVARSLVLGGGTVSVAWNSGTRGPLIPVVSGILVLLGLGIAWLVWPGGEDTSSATDSIELIAHLDSFVAEAEPEGPDTQQEAQKWLESGNRKAQAGQFAEAIEDYDKAVQLSPQFARAYANRGGCKGELLRFAEAIEDHDQAIQLDLRDAMAYRTRGFLKAKLGSRVEAIADFDKAIELDPRNAVPYVDRGVSKANLKRYAEAIADFDQAILLGVSASKLGAVEQLREQARGELSKARLESGTQKAEAGKHAEAIEDFDQAIQLNPRSGEAYFQRARSKACLNRHAESIEDYDKLLQVGPQGGDNANVFFNRGLSRAHLRQYAEAITDFDKTIQLKPHMGKAYFYRGGIKNELGRHAEAIEDLDQAVLRGLPDELLSKERLLRKQIEANLNSE